MVCFYNACIRRRLVRGSISMALDGLRYGIWRTSSGPLAVRISAHVNMDCVTSLGKEEMKAL